MRRLNCKTILIIAAGLISLAASAQAAEPAPSDGVRPRLYLDAADLSLLRQNAARTELSAAYADLESRAKKSAEGWLKKYPSTGTPRTTDELIALGRRDNPGRDHKTIAAAYALRPTPGLGRVLREKLLATLGARRINNYWRNDGIHEGETVMQFLEAWDIASGAGLLTESDQREIKDEMRRVGHFLEGWTLDNDFSQGYLEYYRNVYCLNFHVFATSVMGTIAMLFPDLPESPELELHYKGIPLLVDPGTVGIYQNWNTYGGYCKATVAHNTVGIGNQWGHDRLDGRYEDHVKEHGREFLYETSQKNIGRADTELKAFGDTSQIGIVSARLKTYADVNHQRTVVWFRDTGVAVVNDSLESPNEHTYEWYLNPIGRLLKQDKILTFGDEVAKLDVVPVLPKDARVQIVSKDDPKVPPYYVALRPDSERSVLGAKGAHRPYVMKDRWELATLLVLQSKAKNTDFLNVLIPYQGQSPLAPDLRCLTCSTMPDGAASRRASAKIPTS